MVGMFGLELLKAEAARHQSATDTGAGAAWTRAGPLDP